MLFIDYTVIQVFTKSYNNTRHKTLCRVRRMLLCIKHEIIDVCMVLAPKLGLCRESEKGLDLESAGLTYICVRDDASSSINLLVGDMQADPDVFIFFHTIYSILYEFEFRR